MIGFNDAAVVAAIQSELSNLVASRHFKLSGLIAVTVATDYSDAVAKINTGFEKDDPMVESSGVNAGLGMTPELLRDGSLRSEIVLSASTMAPLAITDDSEQYLTARYLLTHEAAHAEELFIAAEDYGQKIFAQHDAPDPDLQRTRTFWSEYYACQRSAFSYPGIGGFLIEMFVTPITNLEHDLRTASADFKTSGNADQYGVALTDICENLFTHFARLVGHLDGLSTQLPDEVTSLEMFQKAWPILSAMRGALRQAHSQIGSWGGLEFGLGPLIYVFNRFVAAVQR